MPTYEYRCPNGHTLEDFQSMTASTRRLCPECFGPCPVHGGDMDCCPIDDPCMDTLVYMERVIGTGAGVIWKGGPPTRRFGK